MQKDKDIQVNMLINNAGLGGTTWFEEGDPYYFKKQIQVNILSTVQLTHLLLPVLCRQPSYILNVSSLCTFFFLPKKQVYGASKSFIYYFSKSLRRELKKDGITVSVLCPGGINSNPNQYLLNQSLYGIAKLSVMNPECVAKIAINGLLNGNEVIILGWYNKLFLALNYIIPQRLKDSISEANMKKIRPTALSSLLRFDI
ncbi:MAG: SDR family NAD(P)-dependent oxidoreductase [Daejeonella sp.]